jgi:hypothetical protein
VLLPRKKVRIFHNVRSAAPTPTATSRRCRQSPIPLTSGATHGTTSDLTLIAGMGTDKTPRPRVQARGSKLPATRIRGSVQPPLTPKLSGWPSLSGIIFYPNRRPDTHGHAETAPAEPSSPCRDRPHPSRSDTPTRAAPTARCRASAVPGVSGIDRRSNPDSPAETCRSPSRSGVRGGIP